MTERTNERKQINEQTNKYINKLEKHSESADLRQAAPFPHTMIPTKRTLLYFSLIDKFQKV